MTQNVVILGASHKPDRFSNKALKMLVEYGHKVMPVHPRLKEIDGFKCFLNLESVKSSGLEVDTLTMYVRSEISSQIKESIFALKPKRVIFNPGAENQMLKSELDKLGVQTINHCTLVMLSAGEF